jgi:hypothetical protein
LVHSNFIKQEEQKLKSSPDPSYIACIDEL